MRGSFNLRLLDVLYCVLLLAFGVLRIELFEQIIGDLFNFSFVVHIPGQFLLLQKNF